MAVITHHPIVIHLECVCICLLAIYVVCTITHPGEQILLQGVVDCALVEKDGITVVDFKTDYVTDATLPEVLARYRPQVDTYSRALERIYEMPVKGTCLYFFHLKKLIAV